MVDWFAVNWYRIFEVAVPFIVALTAFIKNANKNQKETQNSIEELKTVVKTNNTELNNSVEELNKKFSDHLKEEEEDKAKQARMRILRFYDELCANIDHSESYFEDILDDCKFYEKFCREHTDFQNHRGQAAIDYIDETYRRVKQNGGFLKHN